MVNQRRPIRKRVEPQTASLTIEPKPRRERHQAGMVIHPLYHRVYSAERGVSRRVADVYSLGVILSERLTCQPLFTGDDVLTILRKSASDWTSSYIAERKSWATS